MEIFTKQFLSNFKYEIPQVSEKEDQEKTKKRDLCTTSFLSEKKCNVFVWDGGI